MTAKYPTTNPSRKKLSLLETAPLFEGVPLELLEKTLNLSREVKLLKGHTLFEPGEVFENIYVISSGRLCVQKEEVDSNPVAMYGQGDCVGEISMIGDGHAAAFTVAATDCELIAFDLGVMWMLVENSHKAALNLLRILSQRTQISEQHTSDSLEQHNGFQGFDMVDKVTGLYNQHWMHKELGRYLKRCLRDNRFSCLIMLKIDNYQSYVEKYGVLGGEQALRAFANTITSCQRPEDLSGHYLNSKFIVFLPYTTSLEDACRAAERLRVAINNASTVLPSGDSLPNISASLGVSQLSDDGLSGLLNRAEEALQSAENSGGNCVKSVAAKI